MNANDKALIRQIAAHVTCSVCGHHFGTSDIQVVGRREQVWAMRVNCRECRTQALVLAVVNDRVARPVYTDLTPDEWVRFRNAPLLDENDVIATHEFLSGYAGDFSEIMDEPLPDE